MNEEKKYIGISEDGYYYPAKNEDIFLQCYQKAWVQILSDTYYQSEQLDIGHKFRPRLVYWGYLAGNPREKNESYDSVAQIAVCIELVHKASILLDDFIDKDTARHGKPTFHSIHGIERTVMYSLNILSKSLNIMNNIFYETTSEGLFCFKSMQSLTTTLYEMTLGVLKELDLKESDFQEINEITEIMHLETSSLITNSLLMGYYLSQKENNIVEHLFKSIGKDLGYIFQIMNDLEPFCNISNNEHKGSLNTDVTRNRKNICIPILATLMSNSEKKQLLRENLNNQDDIFIHLFKKYNVRDILLNETDNVIIKIQKNVSMLSEQGISSLWCTEFMQFLYSVVEVCKNRLST